jgi:two-component system, OmpR family, KDP operon response regulator KdpE
MLEPIAAPPSKTILVVEDEVHTRRVLRATLAQDGYDVIEAATGQEALTEYFLRRPGVVLLDLGLPDMDGVEVTSQIRQQSNVPIIIVSARGEEEDQVAALDEGANDYVIKPYREGELLARIRVAFRYAQRVPSEVEPDPFVLGALRMVRATRQVFVEDREVILTPTEFRLLGVMARNAGRVVTHQQLLREVWGPEYAKEIQYLRVYMRQLRYKIEKEPAQPAYLLTCPGVGYRLKRDD